MTSDEVLAVIRERIASWRYEINRDLAKSPEAKMLSRSTAVLLDDLDPDRIDQAGRLREELAKDCGEAYWAIAKHPRRTGTNIQMMADALLAKGWRK